MFFNTLKYKIKFHAIINGINSFIVIADYDGSLVGVSL